MSISQIKSFFPQKNQMQNQLRSSHTSIDSAIANSSKPSAQDFSSSLNLKSNSEAPTNTGSSLANQALYNNENWLDTGAKLATANLDYREAPSRVGDFVLDPSQSRIQSAIDLGQVPFATNTSTIASTYNIGSSLSAGISSNEGSDTNYIEDLFKEEAEEESENSLEGLGEEQEKLFDSIDKFQREENQEILEIKAKQNPDGPEAEALKNQGDENLEANIDNHQLQEEGKELKKEEKEEELLTD